MGAPKPFTIKRPVVATEIPPPRQGKAPVDHGPNQFLQPDPDNGFPDGWLAESYKNGLWYDVQGVTGEFVMGVIEHGKRKGEPVERMTGDLLEVTRQIREAADTLGIGVAIRYFPAVYRSGPKKDQEIPGTWVVKYLGQNRKQRREKTPAESAPVAE